MIRAGCLIIVLCWGCGVQTRSQQSDSPPPAVVPPASGTAGGEHGGAMPHGDHRPHYGGIVLMNGDLHFEVVVGADGRCRIYFSDELRRELPASTVSEVVLTILRPHGRPETLILDVDDAGESWVATGRPIADPQAMLRVAYVFEGKTYWIDVPWTKPVPDGSIRAT